MPSGIAKGRFRGDARKRKMRTPNKNVMGRTIRNRRRIQVAHHGKLTT